MSTRIPYFYSADRTQVLLNEIHLWSATRWRHAGTRPNAMKCGIHGDCLFWVPLFKKIGALPEHLTIPDYRLREALADEMQKLRKNFEDTGRAQLVWERPENELIGVPGDPLRALHLPWLYIGDILLFVNGNSGAHCGLMVQSCPIQFLHLSGNGLNKEPLHQSHYLASLKYIYRLLEDQ
jgi:hypothetical protein